MGRHVKTAAEIEAEATAAASSAAPAAPAPEPSGAAGVVVRDLAKVKRELAELRGDEPEPEHHSKGRRSGASWINPFLFPGAE